jgi:hypothetical protein
MKVFCTASSILALAASAAAFAPTDRSATSHRTSGTSLKSGMDDLKVIAEKSNPVLKVRRRRRRRSLRGKR